MAAVRFIFHGASSGQKKPLQQRSLQGLELPGGSLVWDENKERQSVLGIVGIGSV
jgi:hypothetical protein